jgi:hypothetical protein
MIAKRFQPYPQILWTTLWENRTADVQIVDLPSIGLFCLLSRQGCDSIKINDLAQIRANPDSQHLGPDGVAAQHEFWG